MMKDFWHLPCRLRLTVDHFLLCVCQLSFVTEMATEDNLESMILRVIVFLLSGFFVCAIFSINCELGSR